MRDIVLSRASEDDSIDIWTWRNDPVVRRNFFITSSVSRKEHAQWYKKRLRDPYTAIYIARSRGEKVGVIRFEKKQKVITVSVNVAPHLIGKGFGSQIIKLGTERYYAETKEKIPVSAKIKLDNKASQRAFQKSGYRKAARNKYSITLMQRPEDLYLHDKELRLRPLQKEHINDRYLNWLNDPEVTRFLETKSSTKKELNNYYLRSKNNNSATIFAIELRGRHIGNVKLDINWKHGFASIGIMIGEKKQWGKGYGTKATRLAAEYALKRLGLYSVILGVYGNHISAIESYRSAGFKVGGRIPKMLDFEGKRVDKVMMSMVRGRGKRCKV